MKKIERALVSLMLTPMLTLPGVSEAQENSNDVASVDSPNEIIVTAQKRSESINRVPITMQALSNENLLDRGIASTADLAKIVPGFTSSNSGYGSAVYTLRGIGLNDYGIGSSPSVATYIDEVPLSFPVMLSVQPNDLERVEVLKGPQGILFGQSSTGGAVNYISAKPTDRLATGGSVSVSNFGKIDLNGYVSGPLSESLNARVSFRGVAGGDWQRSTTRDDHLGESDVKQGRLLLEWEASDRLTINFNANGYIDRSDIQAPQLISLHPVVPELTHPDFLSHPIVIGDNRDADWYPEWPMDKNDKFGQLALRGDLELGGATITALASYQHMKVSHYFDYDATQVPDAVTQQFGNIDSFNGELRASGSTGALSWLVGATYEHADVSDNLYGRLDFYSGGQPFPDLPRLTQISSRTDQKIENFGVFGNFEFAVNDHLNLYAGARYSDSKRSGESCNFDGGSGNEIGQLIERLQQLAIDGGLKQGVVVPVSSFTCFALNENYDPVSVDQYLHEDNLSIRAGFDYSTQGGTLLYGNFRRGFKDGILPMIPGFSAFQAGPAVQERVDAWEVGFKAPMLDRRVQLNAAAFYYKYKDKQVLGNFIDPLFGVLTQEINVPRSRIWGIEGELIAKPEDGLTISGNVAYINSRIQGNFIGYNATGVEGDLGGSSLPFSPEWTGMVDVEYEWAVAGSLAAFVGASVAARSKDNATFANENVSADEFKIASYALLDLRAGVGAEDGRWKLSLWGRNITDKYYWTTAFAGVDASYRYTGMPATYGATLALKFD